MKNAVNKVVDAWTIEGPAPNFHRAAQAKLRKEWPTLARAVEDLCMVATEESELKQIRGLYKEDAFEKCPKCGQGNSRGMSIPGGPYIPSYWFASKPRYCEGSACTLAPMTGEHMHRHCKECDFTWAEDMPDLTPKPKKPKKPKKGFWRSIYEFVTAI